MYKYQLICKFKGTSAEFIPLYGVNLDNPLSKGDYLTGLHSDDKSLYKVIAILHTVGGNLQDVVVEQVCYTGIDIFGGIIKDCTVQGLS